MKLIEKIIISTPTEIADYLENVARQGESKLQAELKARNSDGVTALYLAVQRSDLGMAEVLLDFGALAQSTFTAEEDYAYSLALENHFQPKQMEIYALIKSRREMQALTLRIFKIPFPNLLRSIYAATKYIKSVKNKTAILLLGETGAGKSTLANFLCGIDYKAYAQEGVNRIKALSPEWVQTGDGPVSVTAFPQILEPPKGRFAIIDLPGFEDTRGTVEEISAAAGVCLLTAQLKGIQQLWFVTSWQALTDSRMVSYRRAAQNVGAMLSSSSGVVKKLTLVVTQGKPDLKEEYVRSRLKTLYQDEGWDKASEGEVCEDIGGDEWAKQCVRRTTAAILFQQNNIFLVDVTRPIVRERMQKYLEQLDDKPAEPKQFNFQYYSRYVPNFQQMLATLQKYFNELESLQKQLPLELSKLRATITSLNLEIKKVADEQAILQEKTKPFDSKPYLSVINTCVARIAELRLKESNILASKKKAESDLVKSKKSFINIEAKVTTSSELDEQLQKVIDEIIRLKLFRKPTGHLEQAKKELEDLKEIVEIQKTSINRSRQNEEKAVEDYQRELWRIADCIHEQQSEISQQEKTMKNDQAVYELAISFNKKQIGMLDLRAAQLSADKERAEKNKDEMEMQIRLTETIKKVNQPLSGRLMEIAQIFNPSKSVTTKFAPSTAPKFRDTHSVRVIPEKKIIAEEAVMFSLTQLGGRKAGLTREQVRDSRFRSQVLSAVKQGIPFAEVIDKSNDQINSILKKQSAKEEYNLL